MDAIVLINLSLFALNINSMNTADPLLQDTFYHCLKNIFNTFLFWRDLEQSVKISTVNIALKAFEGLM